MHVLMLLLVSDLLAVRGVEVDMSDQGITSVTSAVAGLPTNTAELLMNENLIEELPANAFSALTSLWLLQLASNNIHTISDSAFTGTVLESINLYSNEMSIFPNLSSIASTLGGLNMDRNRLTSIPPDAFVGFTQLSTLKLSENLFTQSPDLSSITCRLVNLYLSKNQIATLVSTSFQTLTRMKKLDLSNNKLAGIPDLKVCSNNLQSLSLTGNQGFTNFPETAFACSGSKVTSIDVRYCNISSPLDLWETGKHVTVLNLQGNPLHLMTPDELFASFDGLVRLKTLTLSSTGLNTIRNVTENLPALVTLNLKDIPLHCDHRISWIQDAIDAGIAVNMDNHPCSTPFELTGLTWNAAFDQISKYTDSTVQVDSTILSTTSLTGSGPLTSTFQSSTVTDPTTANVVTPSEEGTTSIYSTQSTLNTASSSIHTSLQGTSAMTPDSSTSREPEILTDLSKVYTTLSSSEQDGLSTYETTLPEEKITSDFATSYSSSSKIPPTLHLNTITESEKVPQSSFYGVPFSKKSSQDTSAPELAQQASTETYTDSRTGNGNTITQNPIEPNETTSSTESGFIDAIASTYYGASTDALLDDKPSTCFFTGFESSPWIKFNLGKEWTVQKVVIKGLRATPGIVVRVGNVSEALETRSGHGENAICSSRRDVIGSSHRLQEVSLDCKQPIRGRWLSVESLSKEEDPFQLAMCDVLMF